MILTRVAPGGALVEILPTSTAAVLFAIGLQRAAMLRMRRGFVLLLVEDDPVLGPMTAEALEIFGHVTTLANTVNGAFYELCHADFDAIVLDLGLGDERGETLVTNAREAGLRLPTIMILSALPLDVLNHTQKLLGARGALQKPASIEELAHALERCIPASGDDREFDA